MSDLKSRETADPTLEHKESTSERNQRREIEIAKAMQEEAARHRAEIGNMHRLRALRLARNKVDGASRASSPQNS
jgi:hypothetical protein